MCSSDLAALIGGAMAHTVFRGKVHIGYLAAIVAASNAGGSGSVVGDTTTTMMWIDGVDPLDVLHAYVAAIVAVLVFGIPAALQQQKYSPIMRDEPAGTQVDWARVGIVAFILSGNSTGPGSQRSRAGASEHVRTDQLPKLTVLSMNWLSTMSSHLRPSFTPSDRKSTRLNSSHT